MNDAGWRSQNQFLRLWILFPEMTLGDVPGIRAMSDFRHFYLSMMTSHTWRHTMYAYPNWYTIICIWRHPTMITCVVITAKKLFFGFCFQKWRCVTFPKSKILILSGFCFQRWRWVMFPGFGFCFRDSRIRVKAIWRSSKVIFEQKIKLWIRWSEKMILSKRFVFLLKHFHLLKNK